MSNASRKQNQAKETERQRETSKAAQKSLEAQKKARELTQAAAAAGDPDERQKLLNEALERAVEAENFGKTAKYLQTGAFQGLCAGAGLGSGIGVSLGVVTGTLVGGTTSLVTGGLGAGLGLGVGAAHGPWFKVGEMMGEGIRKVTGDIPGWKATEEQKAALEKMVNGVREQERPGEEELVQMTEGSSKVVAGKGYTGRRKEDEEEKGILQGGRPSMPSLPGPSIPGMKSKKADHDNQTKSKVQDHGAQNARPIKQSNELPGGLAGEAVTPSTGQSKQQSPSVPKSQAKNTTAAAPQNTPRQAQTVDGSHSHAEALAETPIMKRKSNAVLQQGQEPVKQPTKPRKQPRKLEIRSTKSS